MVGVMLRRESLIGGEKKGETFTPVTLKRGKKYHGGKKMVIIIKIFEMGLLILVQFLFFIYFILS